MKRFAALFIPALLLTAQSVPRAEPPKTELKAVPDADKLTLKDDELAIKEAQVQLMQTPQYANLIANQTRYIADRTAIEKKCGGTLTASLGCEVQTPTKSK